MPLTPARADGEHAPVPPRLTLVSFGREEINPDAIDHTLVRMFRELVRNFSIEEKMKDEELKNDPPDRERHVRILANLERQLERMAHFESGLAAARKKRAAITDEDARRSLEARVDSILVAEFKRAGIETVW